MTPSSRSRLRIDADMPDCETQYPSAAWVKFRCSATATKNFLELAGCPRPQPGPRARLLSNSQSRLTPPAGWTSLARLFARSKEATTEFSIRGFRSIRTERAPERIHDHLDRSAVYSMMRTGSAPSRRTSSTSGWSSTPPTSCSAAWPRYAAALLRGKHKPTFATHIDTGDFVIIVNADKVALTGQKLQKKLAYRPPAGLPWRPQVGHSYDERLEKNPIARRREEPCAACLSEELRQAAHCSSKLKVYAGAEHPHAAQQPKTRHLRLRSLSKRRPRFQRIHTDGEDR